MSMEARSVVMLIVVLLAALTASAALIWLERRLLAVWQDRYGPNRVGPLGLMQVGADVIKIFTKEDWTPPFADRFVFVVAPAIIMVAVLMSYAVVPFTSDGGVVDLNIGLLFFLAMSSMSVYSVVLAGWSSDSKYSLLGGMRAAAQMLSYEVFMGLSLMGVVVLAGSFNLREIVAAQKNLWFCIPQALGLVVFLIAGLAETRRLPFDMPEAESELVAGYHTEYSGMKFGMFFVGEYLGVTLISAMIVTLFFGGWLGPVLPGLAWFVIKTLVFICLFILMRAAMPRPRSDQLLRHGWKVLLPLALLNLVVTGGVVLLRDQGGHKPDSIQHAILLREKIDGARSSPQPSPSEGEGAGGCGFDGSADCQSAVSRSSNPPGVGDFQGGWICDGLPTGSRRYSRLKTCATTIRCCDSLSFARREHPDFPC